MSSRDGGAMRKFPIICPLLATAALFAAGCGGATVVKVNASRMDVACKRVYFTSVLKQGDAYAEGAPALVITGPGEGVVPVGTSPLVDFAKPVSLTLKVEKAEDTCARFPKGSSWRFAGVLPKLAPTASGEDVYGVDFDQLAGP